MATYAFCQSPPDRWSLQRCLDTALKKNTTIALSRIEWKSAAISVSQARMDLYPSLTFSTPLGVQLGRSINPITNSFTQSSLVYQDYSLNGSLPVFGWKKIIHQLKAQTYYQQVSSQNVNKTENEVSLNILQDYLQALEANEQKKIAQLQLDQARSQLRTATLRFNAGKLSGADLSQLKAQLASDSINLLNHELSYQDNLLQLRTEINIPHDTPFETDTSGLTGRPSLFDLTPDLVYQRSLENLPQIKAGELKIKAAESNLRSSAAAMLPGLSFSYNLASSFSNYIDHEPPGKWFSKYKFQLNGNLYEQFYIYLNVPIFNVSHLRGMLRQSKLELEKDRVQNEQDNIQLRESVYKIYSDGSFALKKLDQDEIMIKEFKNAYDMVLKSFEIGTKDATQLVISQNNLSKARIQQVLDLYDCIFKYRVLLFYKEGKL